jgi:hypothetical protein
MKTFKHFVESINAKEYDYEGEMAKNDMEVIIMHCKHVTDMLEDTTNLPEWVQSKITLAKDYMSTVCDYLHSNLDEDVKKSSGPLKKACWKGYTAVGMKMKGGRKVPNCVPEETQLDEKSAAWQRKEGKNPEGGLNRKGIASYRRENPGSKLSMAVTTPPSKLKKGSKAANRRKSFCARMGGMPGPMKDEKGRPTRKALSLRKWNC